MLSTHRLSQAICLCSCVWIFLFLTIGGKGKLISIAIGMIPPLVIMGALPAATTSHWFIPSTHGEWNLYRGTLLLVILPMILRIFLISLSNPWQRVANFLGISALPAIAISLVPVSRYSRILQTCGWTVPQAIHEIHVSLGWYSVWAGALHAVYYLVRWWIQHEASINMFLPSLQCWIGQNVEKVPCFGCDCPRSIHYTTGAVVALCFLSFVVTGHHYVRRRNYTLFYRVHVVAAPLAIVFLYMHWRKTTMYVSGGVIVYLASWAPNFLEQAWQKRRARILAIDRIPCSRQRDIVVLTISASKNAMFAAGQFVKLYAPAFSRVSHPFTVFTGPEQDGTFQIMFRQSGSFTRSLGRAICDSASESDSSLICTSPMIYLDGFHGSVDRLHQMRHHDQVVLVAGGIGITPMIALISHLVAEDAGSNIVSPLSAVKLYWVCRDEALIRYVKERFFDAWADIDQHVQIQCVVHKTALPSAEASETERCRTVEKLEIRGCQQVGVPFEPSVLSSASWTIRWNLLVTGICTLATYALYYTIPPDRNVLRSLIPPLFFVAWPVMVSIGALLLNSQELGYRSVPLSDNEGIALKPKSSFSNRNVQGENCTWEVRNGRPSVTEMRGSLSRADHPAVFLCGPSSLTTAWTAELKNCCLGSSGIALYIEHFEL